MILDPADSPSWGVRFCRHFTISQECVETKIKEFPFFTYHHVCLTYRKLDSPRAGHVTAEMEIFIDGKAITKSNIYIHI